jgi:hypothetical protein
MPLEPTPGIAPPRVQRPCVQRPNATPLEPVRLIFFPSPFGSVVRPVPACFWSPNPPVFGADKGSARGPWPAGGVLSSGALLGATGGTQTHSRRTAGKLGRLCYARQGLVRVSESNTKYGGKRGKTGVNAAPVMGQVSVSPQGFPSKKMRPAGVDLTSSRSSQGRYFFGLKDCVSKTHVVPRTFEAAMPDQRLVAGAEWSQIGPR